LEMTGACFRADTTHKSLHWLTMRLDTRIP
jgi:hypothetical protein